jgi:hypothetical protein
MNGIKLNEQATKELVNNIGRTELFDEIRSMKGAVPRIPYPRYLKAVRVTLVSLGFDEKWVDTDFRDALEVQYLEG